MALTIRNASMETTTNILNNHYVKLSKSTERIATGLRINAASDDPAGLAIRELLRADTAALQQGVRNATDATSLIQTADGALQQTNTLLIRMKELAMQASTGTYSPAQREIINAEYQTISAEINRIAASTEFNGVKLLDGSFSGDGAIIHFGAGNSATEDYYGVSIEDASAAALGVGNHAANAAAPGASIATQAAAQNALNTVDKAIASVNTVRANLGATQNRLESTIDSTNIQILNARASESRISDADIPAETTAMLRDQILVQFSVNLLAQEHTNASLFVPLISKRI